MGESDESLRRSVLEAAERVFMSLGIASADLADIAAAARIDVETVSRLFASKDEIFLTIAVEASELQLEAIEATRTEERAAGKSGFDVVSAVVARALEFSREHREKYFIAVAPEGMGYAVDETHPLFARYKERLRRIGALADDMFSVGQEDGSIRRSMTPERLTPVLWGAVVGIIRSHDKLEPRSSVRPRSESDPTLMALQLLLDGLRVKAG
jgi:AcrR family transcriptional regulator